MDEQLVRDQVTENRKFEKELTKRNEQYIFDLKKNLTAANFSDEAMVTELNAILPKLVEGQKTGQTARQLLGTVSEQANVIMNKPKAAKAGKPHLMWLDNSLLLFVFLAFMAGVVPMFSKATVNAQKQGLLTILIAAITGGYAFSLIYKYVYRFDAPGADQTGRPGGVKSMIIMIGILLVWMIIFMMAGLIPASLNIVLSEVIYLILAALVFIVRYYLKKKYHIKGSILTR